MKFRYKVFGAESLRPVIPVALEYQGRRIRYDALIDSGADVSIFDAQIGELLGIDIEGGIEKSVSGFGDGTPESLYLHELTVRIEDEVFVIPVAFKRGFSRFGHGVLGQRGFFEKFIVSFDRSAETVELTVKNGA